MSYLKDFLIVNKKAIPKTFDRIMKFWYVIPLLALVAFVWSAYISPALGYGLVARLIGYVIQVIGGGSILYLLRQVMHDGKVYDWKLYNGIKYYARPIFIYLMIQNLVSYGISLVAQFMLSSSIGVVIYIVLQSIITVLLSVIIEYIYLTNKTEEQIFNDYAHFVKENILVWFVPVFLFQLLMGYLGVMVAGFGIASVVVVYLLSAAFYFYRASVFEQVVDTSVRKRAFMRLM